MRRTAPSVSWQIIILFMICSVNADALPFQPHSRIAATRYSQNPSDYMLWGIAHDPDSGVTGLAHRRDHQGDLWMKCVSGENGDPGTGAYGVAAISWLRDLQTMRTAIAMNSTTLQWNMGVFKNALFVTSLDTDPISGATTDQGCFFCPLVGSDSRMMVGPSAITRDAFWAGAPPPAFNHALHVATIEGTVFGGGTALAIFQIDSAKFPSCSEFGEPAGLPDSWNGPATLLLPNNRHINFEGVVGTTAGDPHPSSFRTSMARYSGRCPMACIMHGNGIRMPRRRPLRNR